MLTTREGYYNVGNDYETTDPTHRPCPVSDLLVLRDDGCTSPSSVRRVGRHRLQVSTWLKRWAKAKDDDVKPLARRQT